MATPGESGTPYRGSGGKRDQYMASLADAQRREGRAIQDMLRVNAQNKVMLAQKTWETQYGSCTNSGQKAIFDSFRSEWFKEMEIGMTDSYEGYLNRWGAKASSMSLSAASITAITGQLSVGYAFNISLGFSLFGNDYGRSEDQVLQILDYIDRFLSTLSQKRGFSRRSRNYRGAQFSRASVKGFGNAIDAGIGEALGGGRTSIGAADTYSRGRLSSGSRGGYDRNGRRRGYDTAERRAGGRALGTAEGRAGATAARRVGASVARRAARYVLRYGRFFIL